MSLPQLTQNINQNRKRVVKFCDVFALNIDLLVARLEYFNFEMIN